MEAILTLQVHVCSLAEELLASSRQVEDSRQHQRALGRLKQQHSEVRLLLLWLCAAAVGVWALLAVAGAHWRACSLRPTRPASLLSQLCLSSE